MNDLADRQMDEARQAATMHLGSWVLMRHGGNSNHRWRLYGKSPDESNARDLFTDVRLGMHRGSLVLINPQGIVVHYYSPTRHTGS